MKKILDSGAELEITLAPVAVGWKLFKAVASELESVNILLGSQDSVINTYKTALFRLLASDRVEDAVWGCLERATYKGMKINRDTFENEKAREDFLPVVKEVCEVNLAPFYRNLSSQLLELLKKTIGIQKSEPKE